MCRLSPRHASVPLDSHGCFSMVSNRFLLGFETQRLRLRRPCRTVVCNLFARCAAGRVAGTRRASRRREQPTTLMRVPTQFCTHQSTTASFATSPPPHWEVFCLREKLEYVLSGECCGRAPQGVRPAAFPWQEKLYKLARRRCFCCHEASKQAVWAASKQSAWAA